MDLLESAVQTISLSWRIKGELQWEWEKWWREIRTHVNVIIGFSKIDLILFSILRLMQWTSKRMQCAYRKGIIYIGLEYSKGNLYCLYSLLMIFSIQSGIQHWASMLDSMCGRAKPYAICEPAYSIFGRKWTISKCDEKNEQTRTERTMTTNFDQNAPCIHIQMNIVAYSNNTVAIWYKYEIKWQAQVHKYIYGKWLFSAALLLSRDLYLI